MQLKMIRLQKLIKCTAASTALRGALTASTLMTLCIIYFNRQCYLTYLLDVQHNISAFIDALVHYCTYFIFIDVNFMNSYNVKFLN